MRAFQTVRATVAGVVLVGMCMGAAPTIKPADDEVGQLREQMKVLSERNAKLEADVMGLRGEVDRLNRELEQMRPKLPRVPMWPRAETPDWMPEVGARVGPQLPPGTRERRFNGMTYYVIPVKTTAK